MVVKIEILLSHEEFVRTLARRLVIDEHLVDDVLQETWLAALERPPRSTGALRTWLATVARNFVFSTRRDAKRRILRERGARPQEGAPDPAEIVEREAARRCLVESVLDLDKMYRDPILLRYYEDCAPREIARRLGLPVETVRTRIKRGLAQLRRNLDAVYGGDRQSWCLALLLVSGLEKKILASGLRAVILEKIPRLLALNASSAGIVAALGLLATTVIFAVLFIGEEKKEPPPIAPIAERPAADTLLVDGGERSGPARNETPPVRRDGQGPVTEEAAASKEPPSEPTHPAATATSWVVRDRSSLPESGPPPGMVLIPGGETWLGMSSDEAREWGDGQPTTLAFLSGSIPRHSVRVDPFYCNRLEVTNARWAFFLEKSGRKPSQLLVELSWRGETTIPEGEGNLPIRNVTLDDARAYARWCGKRLPTEAEWMRAAAGDDGRLYSWGNEFEPRRCSARDEVTRREMLTPVGSFPEGASPFGILDMTGSVWEWTVTPFEAYEGFEPIVCRVGRKRETLSPGFDARQFVVKGGVYNGNDLVNLLAIRQPCLANTNLDSLGFRCVRDAAPGRTLFHYVEDDLGGAPFSISDYDQERAFFAELTEKPDSDRPASGSVDYLLITPMRRADAFPERTGNNGPERAQVIGALSTSLTLEIPALGPGSYVLAYHPGGPSRADGSSGSDSGDTPSPPIEFPRDRDTVLFMNRHETVVGFVEPSGLQKQGSPLSVRVAHSGDGRMTEIDLGVEGAFTGKGRIRFRIAIEKNPLR